MIMTWKIWWNSTLAFKYSPLSDSHFLIPLWWSTINWLGGIHQELYLLRERARDCTLKAHGLWDSVSSSRLYYNHSGLVWLNAACGLSLYAFGIQRWYCYTFCLCCSSYFNDLVVLPKRVWVTVHWSRERTEWCACDVNISKRTVIHRGIQPEVCNRNAA